MLDSPWLAAGAIVVGGGLLYFGAEWLVKGASGLAGAFGVRPIVIGLTVVAYGTSAPELAVSALSAYEGKSAIALGNVVGSNIANLGLILGSTALVAPLTVAGSLVRRELPLLVVVSALAPLLLLDGQVGRVDGALLLVGALAFTFWTLRPFGVGKPTLKSEGAEHEAPPVASKLSLGALAAVGLVFMVGGGKFFVDGASSLALSMGVSERVVGLTIVAVGTSLPELAASLVAAVRGQPELAVGNVVGSNIFNLLFVLGGASLVHPIPGSVRALAVDFTVMVAVTLVGVAMMATGGRVSRAEGGVLAIGYAAFVAFLAFG
ncbi:MAG: calcium/sodium antiporter [Myxococcota bacterium]